jgi:hypothetical protein
MYKVTSLKIAFPILLLSIFLNKANSQQKEVNSVRIMFYNVENLFDIYNDSAKNDEEFLPEGSRRWNSSRYFKKINSVFRTIAAAGGWSPPEIIGFAEIENRKVLEDLIYNTYLSKYNYGIVHEDSPDSRGIDVGLIYRNDIINIINYCSMIPKGYNKENYDTRSVLYLKCSILGDTIHIIVNHWPSRLGGVLANESLKKDIAIMVRELGDSIALNSSGKAKIIVMGDFNCTWADSEMSILTDSTFDYGIGNSRFINLTTEEARNGLGSYRYQGMWELIDQVIVSDYLMNCENGLYTDEKYFSIFNSGFLLKRDPKYPGMTPFSTFSGYRYQGGYSDHLPVLLELRAR